MNKAEHFSFIALVCDGWKKRALCASSEIRLFVSVASWGREERVKELLAVPFAREEEKTAHFERRVIELHTHSDIK